MLGIRPEYDGLMIDPCVPSDWKRFEVTRKWRGATYRITVENPRGARKGISSVTMNGTRVSLPLPVQPAGSQVDVVATM
jgi:N,N'-diacetylchitobiose phosphorylase